MEYYAIQVRTRSEERYIRLFTSHHPGENIQLLFPRRRLSIRRKGVTVDELAPVFPGYVFLVHDGRPPNRLFWSLRRTDGFYRILKSNKDIRPLEGSDLKVVLHFIGIGTIAEKSKVYFNDEDRIVVKEGPLKGLEGQIVKVDKRKGRAKIKLDLYDDSFAIDLAFEVIERP